MYFRAICSLPTIHIALKAMFYLLKNTLQSDNGDNMTSTGGLHVFVPHSQFSKCDNKYMQHYPKVHIVHVPVVSNLTFNYLNIRYGFTLTQCYI